MIFYSALWHLAHLQPRECAVHIWGGFLRIAQFMDPRAGSPQVACVICGWSGRQFRTYVEGRWTRADALCPRCASLERHREIFRVFQAERAGLPARFRMLDIAPAASLSAHWKADPTVDYLSADLVSPVAMRHMDLQALDLPDESFDVVLCCHVLDYVPDDRKALREIRRVLRRGGRAFLVEQWTRSTPTIEFGKGSPETLGRTRDFGLDFPRRIEEAGFQLVEGRSCSASGDSVLMAE